MDLRLEHEHSREAIRRRLRGGAPASYVRDWVYGGIDGVVTTFAVVAGVAGADLSTFVILVLGAANLVGDGFSMAASNYLGTKHERDEFERLRKVEDRHIRLDPAGEREEVRQIYEAKGFRGPDLERIVEVISADRERWVRTMLSEEYGLPSEIRSPLRAAVATFAAFFFCGMLPLLPFVFGLSRPLFVSTIATIATFFAIGSAKSPWSVKAWWISGIETIGVGSAAAALAYAAARAIKMATG
jgi:VIT1/CCC1 family predicted Fe2+/Mn2+ transporter